MEKSWIEIDLPEADQHDIQLIQEIKKENIQGVRDCLASGANVNAIELGENSQPLLLMENAQFATEAKLQKDTALHCAVSTKNNEICKLLLEHGADLNMKGSSGTTPLEKTIYSGFVLTETLFVESMFVPYHSDNELQNSQKKIFTALCVFKRICPTLPKDIRYKFFSLDDQLLDDAFKSPFAIHKNNYDRLPKLSYSITKLLIANKLVNSEKAVKILFQSKVDCLQPLVKEAFEGLVSYEITSDPGKPPVQLPAPNHESWIDFYGEAIEKNIWLKLGLKESE